MQEARIFLKEFFANTGGVFSEEDFASAFEELDMNHDGMIQKDEMKEFIRRSMQE